MSRMPATLFLVATIAGGTAMAEVPRVAVDIAPVHSLVARVMEGVGTPDLILPPGASPHEYSLKPSQAAALQEADVVVWMGEALAPWMENAIDNLAGDAGRLTLLETEETVVLTSRDKALFEAEDHTADEEHDHDAHDHDGHDNEAEASTDDHEEHHGHEEHAHGEFDPHAWLSPTNASIWLGLIAAELSRADPENTDTYLANAEAGRAELEALTAEISATLDPVRGGSFIVFHDAYQYFERAFDLPAAGAISLSDATDPSPARIGEIRARITEAGIACVLAEPQFNPGIVASVLEGTDAKTAVLDPVGIDLVPGPGLYPDLIRGMASALADCLG